MFAFCTDALGLCKSSAYRRIAAARVCQQYPEVFARVAAGELQTSVLAALSRYLTPENAAALFEACSHKTCEQVEELLAARFPKPDVADSIRRLPARSAMPNQVSSSSMGNLNPSVPSAPSRGAVAADPPAATAESRATPVQRKLVPTSEDRFGVHFTATGEFKRLLEEVRALASHRQPNGDLTSLMTRALEVYRQQLLKTRYGVGRKARRSNRVGINRSEIVSGLVTRSRHVPAAVARQVYLRDGGRCTFCAANGQRCGTTRFLELDHVTPWAEWGESTLENLRLRCRAHNQHAAREHFGGEYVRARIAARAQRKGSDGL